MAETGAVSEGSSEQTTPPAKAAPGATSPRPRKGPISFLSGALTSFGFGWLALQLSSRVVAYYGAHPPHYEARFAQSIAISNLRLPASLLSSRPISRSRSSASE